MTSVADTAAARDDVRRSGRYLESRAKIAAAERPELEMVLDDSLTSDDSTNVAGAAAETTPVPNYFESKTHQARERERSRRALEILAYTR